MVARICFIVEKDEVGISRGETDPIKADGYCVRGAETSVGQLQ